MTAEAKTSINTQEQVFKEKYSWITDQLLIDKGFLVVKTMEPLGAGWKKRIIKVGFQAETFKPVVEVVNLFNRFEKATDSHLTVRCTDSLNFPELSIALAFGIVSCKTNLGLTIDPDKSSEFNQKIIHDFFNQALGIRSILQLNLDDFANSQGK